MEAIVDSNNNIIDFDDEHFCDSPISISDDSEDDPDYSAFEQTRRKLSSLSVRKKSMPRVVEEFDDGIDGGDDDDDEGLEEVDEKSYEEIQKIVGAGKIEKLKVEQCKVYLRKNGLRLTGNKATLIQRINEHLEISNGGGERKYPVSSFFVNCKGDACTGDVVLFEQNVYDMYNIASRSAGGPPCGTRMVAGRIVKESYGAAKQQHTFTIEVLWSRGEKPLPPLHPLLIKGRNLYRLRTLRQKWEDEEERRRKLMEKHARGSLARSDREARVVEKEKRKMLKGTRVTKGEPHRNPREVVQSQQPIISDNSGNTVNRTIEFQPSVTSHKPAIMPHHKPSTNLQAQKPSSFFDHHRVSGEGQLKKNSVQDKHIDQTSQPFQHTSNLPHLSNHNLAAKFHNQPFTSLNNNQPVNNYHRLTSPPRRQYRPISPSRRQYVNNNYRPMSPSRRQYYSVNDRPMSPMRRQNFVPRKPCRYFAQGSCHFGDSCKFSHTME